ncbi:DnaD and phage-associated domain-containing protein [Caminicella sporogenes DSM 14501]|uniref:DnaD and phage-associated domain-containing protein n=1 Tax=Caminicella sporogenes DSM 14501 TaxID=1121266 RepID=A0A1M6NGU0_9FIRM|nr:DnaD domain protein [Caminicella sporogenes]RKD22209.1 primosomal replication protein N [Caminicella sporogenes]SHJ94842.1 DnaD and phage-associated domain-containing protein [Caminicella sporogenes DSM 14501]
MNFIKRTTDIDFGQTPIENIFINDFMPMANGTYVKVYLLGYKYANDRDENLIVDNKTIAKHLNIPLEDVLGAWDFWEQKGIIKKIKKNNGDESDFIVEFLSLRQLYIDNNYKPNTPQKSKNPISNSNKQYKCSPEDLIEANKIPEIKNMFYQIDQIMRRQLFPNERITVLDWIYNFNMDPDIIIKAFEYCIDKKNIKSIRYVGGVIKNWYDNGIIDMNKLEEYLEKTDKKFIYYDKIFKALGFNFRQPSKAEKEVMDIWIDKWGFSLDLILKACENSKKTSNPSINYINSILQAWKKDGITTTEEVEKKELQIKETKSNNSSKSKQLKSNKFQNFKQRFDKYSNEELEKILGIKK